jgi:hypothetical protein
MRCLMVLLWTERLRAAEGRAGRIAVVTGVTLLFILHVDKKKDLFSTSETARNLCQNYPRVMQMELYNIQTNKQI